MCVRQKKRKKKNLKRRANGKRTYTSYSRDGRLVVKKRPTQPSVLFSPQGPFGNPDHCFFFSLTSPTSLTSRIQASLYLRKKDSVYLPATNPNIESSRLTLIIIISRERESPTQSVCFFSSSSYNNTSFPSDDISFFSFHSSRLISSQRERKPARPRRTGASDLVGLPLVSVRGIDYT